MKFWSDASPIVKVAIVVGVLGVIGVIIFNFTASPYGEEEIGAQRGLSAAQ